jgi:isocitrate dehydrogenase kinase/phosphatase
VRGEALEGAAAVREAYGQLRDRFDAVTRHARDRFEARDWAGLLADSVERLGLYRRATNHALTSLDSALGDRTRDHSLWRGLKLAYMDLVATRGDRILAETFFNSVTRRVFTTVGVDPEIEFVDLDFEPAVPEEIAVHETLVHAEARTLVAALLRRFAFRAPWEDFERDVQAIAAEIEDTVGLRSDAAPLVVDFVPALFFRNQGAYLVGRLRADGRPRPLLLALLHRPEGILVDAALMTENDAALVFSYTRSYFLVEVDHPAALVAFLRTLMPSKRSHELWTSLGFNKHGKTQLYRDLLRHLAESEDAFVPARGQRGMVMAVFTLPSFDVVFKVIRDRIERPKETTRELVEQKYQLVFNRDRAGRLVDAQEFEHLQFERARFAPEVLEELLGTASSVVSLSGERVAIRHLYTERRLTPLDVYLREAEPLAAERAVLDYGRALRDLAATNIFPGDLLLKNFGVTRQGRVVFYDYDELALVTDCAFRELPSARDDADELASEPWFYVGENDIFPEEFLPFIGLQGRLRDVFLEAHGELLSPRFWLDMQQRLRAGQLQEIFPYPPSRRLPHRQRT